MMVSRCGLSDHHLGVDDIDPDETYKALTSLEKEAVDALSLLLTKNRRMKESFATIRNNRFADQLGPMSVSKEKKGTAGEEFRTQKSPSSSASTPFVNGVSTSASKKSSWEITSFLEDHQNAKTNQKKEKKMSCSRKSYAKRERIIDNDGEDERRIKRKKTQMVDLKKLVLEPQDLSLEIKERISWKEDIDKDFKLRITKKMFSSDVCQHLDRFSMPCRQIIDEYRDFLTENERSMVCSKSGKGLEVTLVELLKGGGDKAQVFINSTGLLMKQWNSGSTSYVLKGKWKGVLKRNKDVLELEDVVQIYSFRRNEKLWLVLVKVCDKDGRRRGAFGSSVEE